MKNLMILESIIVGTLVGIAVSSYLVFMETFGRNVGFVLNTISLSPVLKMTKYEDSIIASFLFYLFVYILYVVFINLLFKINKKIKISLIIVILGLLIIIGFEQNKAFKNPVVNIFDAEINLESTKGEIKKYFGEYEVFGNLDEDNKEDVAFVIKIEDEKNEVTDFYISAAIKEAQGYSAKNILYVDYDIKIENIKIENNKIYLEYSKDEEKNVFVAEVADGELKEFVEETEEEEVSENI